MPSTFLTIKLRIFLNVINALAATGKGKGNAVISLVSHLGAGAGTKAQNE